MPRPASFESAAALFSVCYPTSDVSHPLPNQACTFQADSASSDVVAGAIPYTQKWDEIKDILEKVTSDNPEVLKQLAKDRKKFSVDGKASQRLVNLIERNLF